MAALGVGSENSSEMCELGRSAVGAALLIATLDERLRPVHHAFRMARTRSSPGCVPISRALRCESGTRLLGERIVHLSTSRMTRGTSRPGWERRRIRNDSRRTKAYRFAVRRSSGSPATDLLLARKRDSSLPLKAVYCARLEDDVHAVLRLGQLGRYRCVRLGVGAIAVELMSVVSRGRANLDNLRRVLPSHDRVEIAAMPLVMAAERPCNPRRCDFAHAPGGGWIIGPDSGSGGQPQLSISRLVVVALSSLWDAYRVTGSRIP